MEDDRIVQLNARAVQLMNTGSTVAAIHSLIAALHRLRSHVDNGHIEDTQERQPQQNESQDEDFAVAPVVELVADGEVPLSAVGVFTLVSRPFFLNERFGQLEVIAGKPNVVAAVLLYNLALAHHLVGSMRANPQARFARALMYYDLAHKAIGSRGSSSECATLLRLACINNKGHIHSQLFKKEESLKCLTSLESAVAESSALIGESTSLTEIFRYFILTVNLFQGRDCFSTAPSA